jgi:hypothetical protein
MAAGQLPSARVIDRVRLDPARPYRTRSGADGPVFELIGRPSPGGVTWAWARTDLDTATVVTAKRELSPLLTGADPPGVVLVYLGHECFVDLRGLRLLIGTAARIRSRGGVLAVVAPPRCLRLMAQLGRIGADLPLIPTARQALWWARLHRPDTQ